MSAKLYNLNVYRPARVFVGKIGDAYNTGQITLEEAIDLERSFYEVKNFIDNHNLDERKDI